MASDILQGKWKQARGRAKQMWGQLTDDDLDQIEGHRDRLVGKLQERYGYSRMEAENEADDFLSALD